MARIRRSPVLFTAVIFVGLMPLCAAAAPLLAAEFPVSATQVARQFRPAAAVDAGGAGLVVWENPKLGLVVRVVDSAGAAGLERRVAENINLPSLPGAGEILAHRYPTVVADGAGGYVVFWTAERAFLRSSFFTETRQILDQDIYGRRLDAVGRPVGAAFRVDDGSVAFQNDASALRFDANGESRIAVVWASDDRVPGATASDGLQGRIFDAAMTPIGSQFRVSRASGGATARSASLAADRVGNLLIAWHSWGDSSGLGIFARRFDASGAALGNQEVVNTRVAGDQVRAAVAYRPNQGYLVVWQGWTGERRRTLIYGQRLDVDGARIDGEFQVSDGSSEYDRSPSLAATPTGYLVSWIKWDRTFPLSVLGRALNRRGAPAAAPFRINAWQPDAQSRTQLASGPIGILSVWEGFFSRQPGISGTWIEP